MDEKAVSYMAISAYSGRPSLGGKRDAKTEPRRVNEPHEELPPCTFMTRPCLHIC